VHLNTVLTMRFFLSGSGHLEDARTRRLGSLRYV
jgi:hypothetical protein